MSLGTPVNWSNPTASPAAQPEAFRYQGESYVRMGNGQVLQKENYLAQQSALNNQAWRAAADNYDPNEPTRQAARAMEAQPYRSPTTNQLVSREQFFAESSSLQRQASNQYDAAMRQRMANVVGAWDTPLPTGVTVDMIPTGDRAFAAAPTAGAIAPARRTAPVGEALRQPINLGIKPRAQPILAKPETIASAGQGLLYGGAAAYGAYAGGAGFFEGAGAGIGGAVGGVAGALGGAAAGGAAGGAAGTFTIPGVGTVGGAAIGGYVGGGIGAAAGGGIGGALGQGLGKFIDDAIPDFFEPPNATDPAAMDSGPLVSPGTPPPFTGGQGPGVLYQVKYRFDTIGTAGQVITLSDRFATRTGPIGGLVSQSVGGDSWIDIISAGGSRDRLHSSSAPQGDFVNVRILGTARVDGQPDIAGDPPGGIAPVRAPNPARQPAAATPRPLPNPIPPPAPSDQPWPATPAQETPDTTPLTPPAPVPKFNPIPTPTPTPTATLTPTDLENPSKTPPNLADNPQTQPVNGSIAGGGGRTQIVWPGLSSPSIGGESISPLEVAIPVVLLEGLRQKVNTPSGNLTDRTQPNPSVQITKAPPVQAPTAPNPPTCIYERQRVMDIQNKATDVQEKASSPVSGFPGLYGIGIESRVKLGQTFDLLGNVNSFMQKAWETTRLQKVINALTLLTVVHNASMISRDVGETLGYAISQGLDVLGVEDEKGQALDVNNWFGKQTTKFFEGIFGEERWKGINTTWNKANRVIASASNIVNTIRSISDGVKEVTEMAAENTGKIGNALKRSGIVTETSYPWMAERVKAQDAWSRKTARFMDGLESGENIASSLAQVTGTVKEIQDELTELNEQTTAFQALVGAPPETKKVATPDENAAIVTAGDEGATNAKAGPAVTATDMEPGNNGTP